MRVNVVCQRFVCYDLMSSHVGATVFLLFLSRLLSRAASLFVSATQTVQYKKLERCLEHWSIFSSS